MGCACKSSGVKKQATQITKRNSGSSSTHSVSKSTSTPERKQIIIRRPVRLY